MVPAGAVAQDEGPVIGLSVKTITNDPFQAAWVQAATDKVEELGGSVQLLVAGGQTAVASQSSQLEDLVTQQVDGIIVSPLDGSAVLPALQKAKDAGVPVILVDQPIAAGNEELYETLIATDNVNAGRALATYLVTAMPDPELKVAIIEGAPGSVAGDDRLTGFNRRPGLGRDHARGLCHRASGTTPRHWPRWRTSSPPTPTSRPSSRPVMSWSTASSRHSRVQARPT